MPGNGIVSTKAEATSLLDAAKLQSQRLTDLLEQIGGNVTSGVYTPSPPRPNSVVIGQMRSGASQISQELGTLQVNLAV